MNIADSILFYFNFETGKARIFQMIRVNAAIINWREKKSKNLPSFENFLDKTKYVR